MPFRALKRGQAAAVLGVVLLVLLWAGGCAGGVDSNAAGGSPGTLPSVLAAESFLADIAQNVAGSRLTVGTLIPRGADPHAFEPTPADVRRVSDAQVFIVNGAGLEVFLDKLLTGVGGERRVIEASFGLSPRPEEPAGGEPVDSGGHGGSEVDPHFWLDPVLVQTYVANIERGLTEADPAGAAEYAANAAKYSAELRRLDAWVRSQVDTVPQARRLLVTDHHSLGYYADRYGFRVVGALLSSFSTGAAPSARQMVELIAAIKETGAPAIFLAVGTNPQLAEQIGRDAGVRVVTGLYTHSVSDPKGEATTYIAMIEYNTRAIVEALR